MSEFAEMDLRRDAFLGGLLHLWQPKRGYRAGIDPVLLAASVLARTGQSVLDLGCGAGAAALCLNARVPGLTFVGLEKQSQFAALAMRNAGEAGAAMQVMDGDVRAPPTELKAMGFDHVLSNPPYYDRARGTSAPDAHRETALGEDAHLSVWVKLAYKRLKPKGYIHLVLKANRLSDALTCLDAHFGSLEVLPVAPRDHRPAELVLLRARKEGKAALQLHPALVLHQGAEHPGDKDHYRPEVSDILRCGGALHWSKN